MAMYAWTSAPDSIPRSTLHSKEIPTAKNAYSGQNYPGFVNKEADSLIDAVSKEFDKAKRQKLMARLQEIYTEELPVLPLYLRASISVNPSNLKNFALTGHQYPATMYANEWDLSATAAH